MKTTFCISSQIGSSSDCKVSLAPASRINPEITASCISRIQETLRATWAPPPRMALSPASIDLSVTPAIADRITMGSDVLASPTTEATVRMRSSDPTDVPPNFITIMPSAYHDRNWDGDYEARKTRPDESTSRSPTKRNAVMADGSGAYEQPLVEPQLRHL